MWLLRKGAVIWLNGGSTRRYNDAVRQTVELPGHYELTRSQWIFSFLALAAAFALLAALGFRIATRADLWRWWIPVSFVAGIAVADLASGLIHWGADTWGTDDLPLIGHRLLVPFRIHHVNPDDFLRRRFIDTNGDVAAVALPVLLALNAVACETVWGAFVTVFGLGFCGIGIFTNQIHQWSHMRSPPRPIRVLQDCGLLLGREEHAKHHEGAYDVHYCITTGWCNRPLERVGAFRHLESAIAGVTGARPRCDDRRYEGRYGGPLSPPEAREHGRSR